MRYMLWLIGDAMKGLMRQASVWGLPYATWWCWQQQRPTFYVLATIAALSSIGVWGVIGHKKIKAEKKRRRLEAL